MCNMPIAVLSKVFKFVLIEYVDSGGEVKQSTLQQLIFVNTWIDGRCNMSYRLFLVTCVELALILNGHIFNLEIKCFDTNVQYEHFTYYSLSKFKPLCQNVTVSALLLIETW